MGEEHNAKLDDPQPIFFEPLFSETVSLANLFLQYRILYQARTCHCASFGVRTAIYVWNMDWISEQPLQEFRILPEVSFSGAETSSFIFFGPNWHRFSASFA